jgi:hypothetical protein
MEEITAEMGFVIRRRYPIRVLWVSPPITFTGGGTLGRREFWNEELDAHENLLLRGVIAALHGLILVPTRPQQSEPEVKFTVRTELL